MALTKSKLIELFDAGEFDDYINGESAWSGRNLLHNWDFRNPINQRGVSGAISTGTYFYDRWMRNSGAVTTNAAYLTIGAGAEIEQRIEGNLLAGATVTVSVMVAGTVINNTGTFPTSAGTASVTLTGWGTATLGYATGYMYVRLSPTAASNVQRVKLELGTVSTLAYDPPMDYGVELAKCQRYFFHFSTVAFGSGYTIPTGGFFSLATPVTMRQNPTQSWTSGTVIHISGAAEITVTSASLNRGGIYFQFSGSGLPDTRVCAVHMGANYSLSADL